MALLNSPVRRQLLDALAAAEDPAAGTFTGLSASELGEALELHVTTVRFHLDQLVAAGLVSSSFDRRPVAGRPRKLYRTAPGSFSAARAESSYRLLAGLLAEVHTDGLTPGEAGVRWARREVPANPDGPAASAGRFLGRVGEMVDRLRPWGYRPDVSSSDGGRTVAVTISGCPFIELAQQYPALVCGIHRGVIAGAMSQLGEDQVDTSLEPFVVPDVCIAHLSTRAEFTG